MKLVSPFQRGTTCQWRCSGMPAPAPRAQVQTHVEPVRLGCLAQRPDRSLDQHLHLRGLVGASAPRDRPRAGAGPPGGARGCRGTCSTRRRPSAPVASTRSGSRSGTTQKTHAPSVTPRSSERRTDVLHPPRTPEVIHSGGSEVGLLERPARRLRRAARRRDRRTPRPRCSVPARSRTVYSAGLELLVADHQRVRRLHQLRRPDLLADRFLRIVDERPADPASLALAASSSQCST